MFVGITPTGWTNDDYPLLGNDISFGQCVSEMALAGYQGCSIGHKFPKDEAVLKAELDRRGLRVSEPGHRPSSLVNDMAERTVEDFRRVMAFIKRMGGSTVVVAELGGAVHQQPVPPIANAGGGRAVGDARRRPEPAGPARRGCGHGACYHHHMGTGVMTRAETDKLMHETDDAVVHLLLDTGHLYCRPATTRSTWPRRRRRHTPRPPGHPPT